jgi:peptidoglycan lytic transglycosylase
VTAPRAARRRFGPIVVLFAALAACTHAPRRAAEEPPGAPAAETAGGEVGLASFYGKRFHGRRTASGARYDMHAMTCAHPRAAFGARLRVTDLENGRTVVVTVTDRGPFKRGRVVDLSLAAARELGMIERGLARVRVQPVTD